MDRVRIFHTLERAAQPLRRAGLGRVVDRVRGGFERGLGEMTVEIDGISMTGIVAQHAAYLEELRDGARESYSTELFRDAIAPGDLVVDVGAHLGWFSIVAARAGAEVLACEPNPDTLPLLRRNVADNGVAGRVRIEEVAASAARGTLTFWRTGGGDASSLHRPAQGERPLEVPAAPLSELVDRDPVVVKVDVEGAELEVLAGIGARVPRTLLIECNPEALARTGGSPEGLWEAIEALGLEPRVIDPAARELRGREALGSLQGYADLLCRTTTS